MRERRNRIHGPYETPGGRWRVVAIRADGERLTSTFASQTEADREIARFRIEAETRTMSVAVRQFIESEEARGLRPSTTERQEYHLKRILQLDKHGHRMIGWLTPVVAARLYLESQGGAVDTHRGGLSVARQWGVWCQSQGWFRASPFAAIKGRGRRKRGKPQLRIEESRTLSNKCLELADQGDTGAVLVLAYLLFGARNTELVSRQVRDLDDGGRLLWIPDSKTAAGRRTLEVPEVLRPHLLKLAEGKKPDEHLWSSADGRARARDWGTDQVPRLCKLAGVPRVTPHGLRGTQSTIATIAGTTASVVSAALGHAGTEVTRSHYLDRETVAAEDRRTVLRVLSGGVK